MLFPNPSTRVPLNFTSSNTVKLVVLTSKVNVAFCLSAVISVKFTGLSVFHEAKVIPVLLRYVLLPRYTTVTLAFVSLFMSSFIVVFSVVNSTN